MAIYPENKAIATLIGERIKGKGLSIRQVAEIAGVSYSHLSKVIKQQVPVPQPSYLEKLAEPLLLSYCDLFVSAGYFDNFTQESLYYRSSQLLEGFSNDNISTLKMYCSFRHIHYSQAFSDTTDEIDASKQWFMVFHAIQNHRQKCDMLLNLLKNNHVPQEIIDEAFYFHGLIPNQFVELGYTPLFAVRVRNFESALVAASQELNDRQIDQIWPIYEQKLEQKRYDQLQAKDKSEDSGKGSNPGFEFDNVRNTGLKVYLMPDGTAFGRIDFNISDMGNLLKIVEKYQNIIRSEASVEGI